MNKKLLERIQKLLSLASSDNEHEAKLAMDLANELLVKHNISMQQAHTDLDYEKTILSEDPKVAPEDKFLWTILQRHFFVKIVTSRRYASTESVDSVLAQLFGRRRTRKTVTFILGSDTNVQIASYVFGYLKRTFKNLWVAYKKETGCKANVKQSFYYGLETGLLEQLQATRKKVETEQGLVLVPDTKLKSFMDDAFNNLKSSKSKINLNNQQAIDDGSDQGKNIRISRGIESKGKAGLYLD